MTCCCALRRVKVPCPTKSGSTALVIKPDSKSICPPPAETFFSTAQDRLGIQRLRNDTLRTSFGPAVPLSQPVSVSSRHGGERLRNRNSGSKVTKTKVTAASSFSAPFSDSLEIIGCADDAHVIIIESNPKRVALGPVAQPWLRFRMLAINSCAAEGFRKRIRSLSQWPALASKRIGRNEATSIVRVASTEQSSGAVFETHATPAPTAVRTILHLQGDGSRLAPELAAWCPPGKQDALGTHLLLMT